MLYKSCLKPRRNVKKQKQEDIDTNSEYEASANRNNHVCISVEFAVFLYEG